MDDLAQWMPIPRTYDPLKAGSIDGTDVKPHDHGVVRAMEATYKTNKHVESDPKRTLFVARLSPATTEEKLRKFFSRFGELKRCHLIRDVITGHSKRYGFVEFHDARDAIEANDANQEYLDEHKIFVDFERERILPGWIPRRLGGGFGGKKESGQLRFGGRDRPFKKPIVLEKKLGGLQGYGDDFNRTRERGHADFGWREGSGRHYNRRKPEWDDGQRWSRHGERSDSRRGYRESRYSERD